MSFKNFQIQQKTVLVNCKLAQSSSSQKNLQNFGFFILDEKYMCYINMTAESRFETKQKDQIWELILLLPT